MKIKITTGFSGDEKFIIDANEAHKAYYLFNNPDMRGTFSNGVALIGKNIQSILPAWNETMGWNPTHKLDDDDWNDIRNKGIDKKASLILEKAREVAKLAEKNIKQLDTPLQEIEYVKKTENQHLLNNEIKSLANKLSI